MEAERTEHFYTGEDKVNIYDDLWIDFQELERSLNPS